MPLSFILDTDIGTNVDDALALAFAVRHPSLDLRAVTTVSGDTRRRALIAKKLLLLAGRDDVEVAAGVQSDTRANGRVVERGHEGKDLLTDGEDLSISSRDAATLLIEECLAHQYEVATIGMQSNVAAAIDRDPAFVDHVPRLTVMGGVFAPVRFLGRTLSPSVDHNLNVDPEASLRALNSSFETLYVPCDVTMNAWLRDRHLAALRGGDALCRALVRQIEAWQPVLRGMGRGPIPEGHAALLHDPLALACMVDRSFVTVDRLPVTVAMYQSHVRTFIDPAAGRESDIVSSVDSEGFADFWLKTVLS